MFDMKNLTRLKVLNETLPVDSGDSAMCRHRGGG